MYGCWRIQRNASFLEHPRQASEVNKETVLALDEHEVDLLVAFTKWPIRSQYNQFVYNTADSFGFVHGCVCPRERMNEIKPPVYARMKIHLLRGSLCVLLNRMSLIFFMWRDNLLRAASSWIWNLKSWLG